MNISSIKKRADEILVNCKPQLIRIFSIMMLINLIPMLFSGQSGGFARLISFILTILFLPFSHGYIVSTLKAVRHNPEAINDEDAFVGFKRFKELFFTYFLISLITVVVVFVIAIAMMIITIPFIGGVLNNIPSIVLGMATGMDIFTTLSIYVQYAPFFVLLLMIIIVVICAAIYLLSIFLFAAPYLLERYNMTGTKAIKESFVMMNGHAFDFFKLTISFIGWILLSVVVAGALGAIFSFIPVLGTLIASALAGLFGIYTYTVKYSVCQTIFFEELAYYRYEQSQQPVTGVGNE